MSVKTYTTSGGETWDSIAFELWGDETKMTALMHANPDRVGYPGVWDGESLVIPPNGMPGNVLNTLVFGPGVVLNVPEVETAEVSQTIAPWD